MAVILIIFIASLALLLFSARIFTAAAEKIGSYFNFPSFVTGIFIVGTGTSLPELVAGIVSVNKGVSEILTGNIIGANISNILLITGLAVVLNRKNIILKSSYINIDLHFLLGSFLFFYIIAYDSIIYFYEAIIGIIIFVIYSIYLIKGNAFESTDLNRVTKSPFPIRYLILLIISCFGIYFGADKTILSMVKIAGALDLPNSLVALTLLSLGTTLPELAVNISAIRKGNAEMALGNILGSCVFNTLMIPPLASAIGNITVTADLVSFSLPLMAACGLLFYLLTQDKKISVWEGLMFVCLYILFIIKMTTI